MMMIALVFKTLIIIIIMMMMMMTIVVMGKIKTIKTIRITQEDDRNKTMKIFKNSKPGKNCVSPWLDLKTSVYGLVHKFITRRNSLTNQAT